MATPSEAGCEIVVFDLDGTLIREDSLLLQCAALARLSPLGALRALAGLAAGRAAFKKAVFEALAPLDPEARWAAGARPRPEVLAEWERAKAASRRVVVATAAYRPAAERVLARLGLEPDLLIATDGGVNLKGKAKLDALKSHVQGRRWAYFGDADCDAPLGEAAGRGARVRADGGLEPWA